MSPQPSGPLRTPPHVGQILRSCYSVFRLSPHPRRLTPDLGRKPGRDSTHYTRIAQDGKRFLAQTKGFSRVGLRRRANPNSRENYRAGYLDPAGHPLPRTGASGPCGISPAAWQAGGFPGHRHAAGEPEPVGHVLARYMRGLRKRVGRKVARMAKWLRCGRRHAR